METYPLLDNAILLFQLPPGIFWCSSIILWNKDDLIILKLKLAFLFVLVCTFWS